MIVEVKRAAKPLTDTELWGNVVTMPVGDLDGFIDQTVDRVCPAPLVVSETALRQLRPVFEELLRTRVALEDIVMASETNATVTGLAEKIRAGAAVLRRR